MYGVSEPARPSYDSRPPCPQPLPNPLLQTLERKLMHATLVKLGASCKFWSIKVVVLLLMIQGYALDARFRGFQHDFTNSVDLVRLGMGAMIVQVQETCWGREGA